MASQKRSASSRPRSARSASSTRSAGSDAYDSSSSQRASTSASYSSSGTRASQHGSHRAHGSHSQRNSRSSSSRRVAATRHSGPGTHRAEGKGPKTRVKGRHLILKWTLGLILTFIAVAVGAFAYLYVTTEIPQPEKVAMAAKTTVYYSDGTTPIGSYAAQNREIIDCSTLPKYVGQAIVASENRTFYQDKGIDLHGITRALITNLRTGSRQGGSTITQQYAERYYLGETTTYKGKLREAILAIKIAQTQSKDTVLCNYMNTIYLGRGAYGIQAAAKAYFNKDAKDLTVSEAAMLAGIIPAPSTWDPAISPKQATSRFNRVIRIMKEDGYITSAQAAEAAMPQTVAQTTENTYQGFKGYLLTMVEQELVNSRAFTKDELETGGYKIVTTFDQTLQNEMQSVGNNRASGMPDGMQIGALAADPRDGSIKSIYGGADYLTHQLNNATQATYEPGSTMKPFALLGAAQAGVSLDTMFNGNSPQTFKGLVSSVANSGNVSYGYVNLYKATAYSINTAFMNLNEKLTPQKTAEIAHSAGITSDIDETSPYNVLGINSVTVKELTQAHATIATGGVKHTLHCVSKVLSSDNKELYSTKTGDERVFEENDCALVIKAMEGTVQYGTGKEARSIGHTIAGKTGTANDAYAASFVGYTPQLISTWAMWYPDANGNPQEIPDFNGYTHSEYPVHLFTEFMKQALADTPNETFPDATDNGKVGGPDGTWGTGAQKTWTRKQQTTVTPRTEENTQQTTPNQTEETQNTGQGGGDGGNSGDNPANGDGNDTNGGNGGGTSGDNPGNNVANGDTSQQ
ncbi:transglycosylase domain-containing protein [Bifidobacterium thermacidophilum]|uniref:Penicillin-binding protein n=1 Tax=Bifidobacterium thermacidophilum subsp. thermacidophilum TaxID=79262 RepID=A0A087EAT9_9BIFI|nr:transglycosylase domain-containing protein [Bifidobacterium thermacidophilum]KFJ04890.1 penicillin-binding protein [Bifidobacterium thermacidophilum subsp. thermacidophilum]